VGKNGTGDSDVGSRQEVTKRAGKGGLGREREVYTQGRRRNKRNYPSKKIPVKK